MNRIRPITNEAGNQRDKIDWMLQSASNSAGPAGNAVSKTIKNWAHSHTGRSGWQRDAWHAGDQLDVVSAGRERGGERIVIWTRVPTRIHEHNPHRKTPIVERICRSYRRRASRGFAYDGRVANIGSTEQEINLRDYLERVVTRWWIVAICIALGIIASFALSSTENKKLTRGATLIYLGQPVSPNGSLVPNPLSSNPLFANALARQAAYQQPAARKAGLQPDALAGRVSVELISTAVGIKGIAVPLVQVIVQGPFTAAESAAASNAMAQAIVSEANRYTDAKKVEVIATRDRLRTRLDQLALSGQETQQRIAAINDDASLSPAERSAFTTPLIAMLQYDSNTEALLMEQLPDLETKVDYIENIEAGRVITPARGSKVAPTSKQFSLLIAVILGLLVGVLAAVLSTVVRPTRPGDGAEPQRAP